MTTIAANTKMMASDSKVDVGGGLSYPADKIKRLKKMLVGAGGNAGNCSRFLDWAARDFKEPIPKWHKSDEESFLALVLRSDGLYFYAPSFPEPEKINADFFAIGTGGDAARVAMMLGKSPKEAVELACQVDGYSGLPVQVLEL